ncbi:uncharacterized protein LOC135218335 [Macrobrachium nipponense]|uniref:uncharacterized protein LOC135218335 n=1 Tax=Macrobrachium nipponense TaxID=159736 RepID=UPI0030C7DB68
MALSLMLAASLAFFCCTTALVVEEHSNITRDDLLRMAPHIILNEHSCDWPVCNFNDTEQTVVIPEGFSIPHTFGVEIYMAQAVHVYPACLSTIYIVKAGFVSTLSARDTENLHHPSCTFNLELLDSRADIISYGVDNLKLNHSTVDTLNLVDQRGFLALSSDITTVENLHWKFSKSDVLDTTISEVIQLRADSDWSVSRSRLDLIHKNGIVFNGTRMNVTDSSVKHVKPRGIKIVRGIMTFFNVSIERLDALAIVAEDPEASVEFSDVTISSAAAECIVLSDREKISLSNVSVDNMEVNSSSPYFKFLDDFIIPENVTKILVHKDLPQCYSDNSTLSCDFTGINKVIEVDSANTSGFQVLQIKNAKSLLVLSISCNVELQLTSVEGTLPHLTTENDLTSSLDQANRHCGMTLTVEDSHLNVVFGRDVSNLTIVNSSVSRLHGGIIEYLAMQTVTLERMDSIYINGAIPSTWRDVEINDLFNITIQSPIQAENLGLFEMQTGALTVDHDNGTTKFAGLSVSIMNKGSLVVKSGQFIIENASAIFLRAEAIYLEEGATLELNGMAPSILPVIKAISVARANQVTLKGLNDHNTSELFIHVRQPPLLPTMNSNLSISSLHLSPYCTWDFLAPLNCDFSSVTNATLFIDLEENENQAISIAYVQGAYFVTIYPSCVMKLHLSEVVKATTAESEKDCSTWLQAEGVHFYNITTGVTDVTLISCSVDLLSPDRTLEDLDLENTRVERVANVHWSTFTGRIIGSHLVRVDGIISSDDMEMFNTTIEKIHPPGIILKSTGTISHSIIKDVASGGITVEGKLYMNNVSIGALARNAIMVKTTGNITNSIINDIAQGGIVVEGLLHMEDVVIINLAEQAITVKGGILILSNVTISSPREDGIISDLNGVIALRNVTIAKKRLQASYYTEDTKTNEECTSWMWGTGLLTVALIVCIIALMSRFFRLRKIPMLQRVFWSGNDEHHYVTLEN